MNLFNRHHLLENAQALVEKTPWTKTLTKRELIRESKKCGQSSISKNFNGYESYLPGTTGYWTQQTENLKAGIETLRCPTIFFTFSMADFHWHDLHRLLLYPKKFNRFYNKTHRIDQLKK